MSIKEREGGPFKKLRQFLKCRGGKRYQGELGVALLAAELEKAESATMPLFESERVGNRI